MPFKVVEELVTLPVELATAKSHLRYIHSSGEDANITAFIKAALDYAENRTWRKITKATMQFTADNFPESSETAIEIPRSPVISVESVQYINNDGTLTTLESSKYELDNVSVPARIRVKPSESWPTTGLYLNAVQVNYTAGYNTISDIPEQLVQAIQMLVAYYFNNREAAVIAERGQRVEYAPMATNALLDMYSLRTP